MYALDLIVDKSMMVDQEACWRTITYPTALCDFEWSANNRGGLPRPRLRSGVFLNLRRFVFF